MLQEIQHYQNTPYCIEPESSIQKYILGQDPQGDATPAQWEESLFEQSRVIEPKDQPPHKAVRIPMVIRANKLETAVQSSALHFLLALHGLLHHMPVLLVVFESWFTCVCLKL